MILEKHMRMRSDEFRLQGEESEPLARNAIETLAGMMPLYRGAMHIISTRLEILDDDLGSRFSHNPIHHMECRIKSPESIIRKARKKEIAVVADKIRAEIMDIAGIRVICNYPDDVYRISQFLQAQNDLIFLRTRDYIAEPKPSGYRSLHHIVVVPVYLAGAMQRMPVEIQIRTIAMDVWASLEHEIRYKSSAELSPETVERLRLCAKTLAQTDGQMQEIFHSIGMDADPSEDAKECQTPPRGKAGQG